VLAVGDAAFQQKCFEQFEALKRRGRTIILVTHDMHAVTRFCDRAMLVDQGKMLQIGGPHEIALAYNELNFGRLGLESAGNTERDRYGDHAAAEIRDGWFEDDRGERVDKIAQGEAVTMCAEIRFHAATEDPILAFVVRNESLHTVFTTSSDWTHGPTGSFAAGETVVAKLRFENWLTPQRYTVSPSIARNGSGADVIDLREDLAAVRIHGTRQTGALIDVPHELRVLRP
jgi:ABC-type sulfate/molybdate transport systems ATPase subunit